MQMETFFIPTENDFRRWIREAVRDCISETLNKSGADKLNKENTEELMSRKEVATLLRISLVTLADWMNRGLPFHKQRRRVYFVKEEVMSYIKTNSLQQVQQRRF
jgi:excisionase family DNA binding protein